MTPPDSPEKAAVGGGTSRAATDFHPMLDVRGPPLAFDIRQGMHWSGAAAAQPARSHPGVARLVINVGPGIFAVDVAPSAGGAIITLSDVYGQLTQAMRARASPTEVSNAALLGFSIPTQVQQHAARAATLHMKVMFAVIYCLPQI